MALDILRGNSSAADAYADMRREQQEQGLVPLSRIQRLTCEIDKILVVAYVDDSNGPVVVDTVAFRASIEDWLREDGVLVLHHIRRIDLYERP